MVASSDNHIIIMTKAGKVFVCGKNYRGQLGLGFEEQMITFTAVHTLPDGVVAAQVNAGEDYTMIIAEDGTVFACGWNGYGQLGLGDTTNRNTFTEVTLPDGKVAKQLISGQFHTMVIAQDGTVFACGLNYYGQLGLGDYDNRNTFTAVLTIPEGVVIKQVVAGGSHTMIIAQDGRVFACGYNGYGQLGLGDYKDKNTFTAVPALPEGVVIKHVVSGKNHTMIIAEDGTVFACGWNAFGQLGLGDKTNRNTFTAVPALPDGKVAKQVNAGNCHTTILTKDGTVFTCGSNYHGQLGMGNYDYRYSLTAIPALPEGVVIKEVVALGYYTMIITQDGTLFACGGSYCGRLGLCDNKNRNTFTVV